MEAHGKFTARRSLILFLAVGTGLCISLTACSPQKEPPAPQAHRYELKGKVVSIDRSKQQLVVDHGDIPGFMAAMTMPYPVKDANLLNDLAPGDQITAQVVVSNDSVWLENIVVVKKGTGAESRPASRFHAPEEGEEVPIFELVNQDGKKIQLDRYRGKAVLLTFIYTRCPMPDFCPLVTRNFAEIEKALAKEPAKYSKTHLLSISFDPKNDTPQALRKYGEKFAPENGKHTFDHWEFAVAPEAKVEEIAKFFGLLYKDDKGLLLHNLSTAIISSDGKIYKWYTGNEWKAAELLKDLSSSLAAPAAMLSALD